MIFELNWPSVFRGEDVENVDMDDGWSDAGVTGGSLVYY